jgi:hypothetical protein
MFTSLIGLPACLALSSCRSVLNHAVFHIAALIATTARCVTSRLRHFSAGSPQYLAETGSSSYGPTVRFRLLPTSSHDDAVTFSYGAVANSDRDFHPANSTLSRAYTKPLARYRTTLNNYSPWPHRKGYSKADVATVR